MTARTRSLTPVISRRREGGRTLIELLIALVLSLLIIGAVGSLYMMSSNASRTSTQLSSAEERGRLAMFFLGEPIALAGYGNLVGVNETRYENGSMTDAHVRVCANGRFTDPLNGDFTCVANAAPGDQLYVSYQADSLPGLAPQGLMQDCLGQNPPNINGVPTVRNVYSVEQTGGGVLEFGCTGNGGGARQTLVRDVEDFKVFFAFDRRNYELGRTTAQYNPRVVGSTLMTAAQIEALPGTNLPASSLANPWNHVIAVYVCVQLRTPEAGTTPDGVSRFRPCPQTEVEAATGTAEVAINDGVARRTFTQVFTVRARTQMAS
jgi:type IV pilus assembly protein PilW